MSTGVIVPQSFGTPKAFKQWIGGQHHVLNLLNPTVGTSRDRGDILHDPLGSLGFACTRLSGDDDTLILVVGIHVVVGTFGDAEDVRRHLQTILALISV